MEPISKYVLFNLSPIRALANEDIIKAMYHLPMDIDLGPYSHVVLANTGRFLASADQSRLVEAVSEKGWSRDTANATLRQRTSLKFPEIVADSDAEYEKIYHFDLSNLEPQIARPPKPDQVVKTYMGFNLSERAAGEAL